MKIKNWQTPNSLLSLLFPGQFYVTYFLVWVNVLFLFFWRFCCLSNMALWASSSSSSISSTTTSSSSTTPSGLDSGGSPETPPFSDPPSRSCMDSCCKSWWTSGSRSGLRGRSSSDSTGSCYNRVKRKWYLSTPIKNPCFTSTCMHPVCTYAVCSFSSRSRM